MNRVDDQKANRAVHVAELPQTGREGDVLCVGELPPGGYKGDGLYIRIEGEWRFIGTVSE